MLCNNIRTEVRTLMDYRINMVHRITNRTFFLYRGARCAVGLIFSFYNDAGNNSMLVGINNVLPGYKTEQ